MPTAYAFITALVQDSGLAGSRQDLIRAASEEGAKTHRDYSMISLFDTFVVFEIHIDVCLPFIFGSITMFAISHAADDR